MGVDDGFDGSVRVQERVVGPPILISDEAVARLNREGLRYTWEPLRVVDEAREAMFRMPDGKSGVVLGSGPNTAEWKGRGWKTLDIDSGAGADFTVDGNLMETVVPAKSQDFLLAECVTMDEGGLNGVGWGRLLNQANAVLKDGGTISVVTAAFEGNSETTLPPRDWYGEVMAQHGFEAIVEVHKIEAYAPGKTAQKVIYHGQKVAEGFDLNRGK